MNDLETDVAAEIQRVMAQVETVIIGKHETVEMALVTLLVGGHLLIEDIPGVGKTTLAKTLAQSLGCAFKRIQFTPDLLPADITGTSIYNQKTQEFYFMPGPVFAQVVLADEINRATPKTQAALLECMEELQVSEGGTTHTLPRPFFVIATQNNIEHAGTYQLPEAQMDRFLMRVRLGYPDLNQEIGILNSQVQSHPLVNVQPVMDATTLVRLQDKVRQVVVSEPLQRYIAQVVAATRTSDHVEIGASPRGSLALMHAAQAHAALQGRTFATPDDVKRLAPFVLAHRLILSAEARVRGLEDAAVIRELLAQVPVPGA
ncbi:AAA family ATPase [Armatimonas rosea]|uniref:MoxR-like ATPase n=1 Tax=Armatimonas rosea TaxID=685828 RepID=A0A7W9SNJ0_ARMRO|nr:MoxR-like ATPase [Armatimonas rosea]